MALDHRSGGASGDIERRLAFLARAADVLSLASDQQQALGRVSDLVVPELADGCIIELLDDGRLRPVAVSTVTRGGQELLRQVLVSSGTDRPRPGPRQTVLQTGTHLLIPDIPEAYWDQVSTDETQASVSNTVPRLSSAGE